MTEISWLLVSALLGALLGAMASLAITFYYDVAIEPFLELLENDDPRVEGKRRLKPRHQFLEVKTRQRKGLCPFGTRRPAWRCRATIDVHRSDGSRAIKDRIIARWSGSLQPFQTSAHGQQVPDVALIPTGQHLDVHASREEKIGIALKYEGHDKCWIFSNESYLFD